MIRSMQELSVEKGIEIQTEQLARWKTKLKTKVYNALVERALRDNHNAKSGYDIFRGTDLDFFVANYPNNI